MESYLKLCTYVVASAVILWVWCRIPPEKYSQRRLSRSIRSSKCGLSSVFWMARYVRKDRPAGAPDLIAVEQHHEEVGVHVAADLGVRDLPRLEAISSRRNSKKFG